MVVLKCTTGPGPSGMMAVVTAVQGPQLMDSVDVVVVVQMVRVGPQMKGGSSYKVVVQPSVLVAGGQGNFIKSPSPDCRWTGSAG